MLIIKKKSRKFMRRKKQVLALFLCVCFFLVSVVGISAPQGIAMEAEQGRRYRGIDVSQWQGNIDFRKVKRAGIRVVYMKSSEGDDLRIPILKEIMKKQKMPG